MRTAIQRFLQTHDKYGRYVICEVGVKEGYHSEEIAREMPNAVVFAVDPYQPYFTETEIETCSGRQDENMRLMLDAVVRNMGRIIPVRMKSHEASSVFKDGFFDLVYIDADHSESEVIRDLNAWIPKVKDGGMICGHDWDRVSEFVQKVLLEDGHDDYSTCADWWMVKNGHERLRIGESAQVKPLCHV